MIIQKYFLSVLTTYLIQRKSWNFDYCYQNNTTPYSTAITSFYSMIFNVYYTILPKITKQFRQFTKIAEFKLIPVPYPLTPILALLICIGGIFLIVTIVLRTKILFVLFQVFAILEVFKPEQLQNKKSVLTEYSTLFFKDLQEIRQNQRSASTNFIAAKSIKPGQITAGLESDLTTRDMGPSNLAQVVIIEQDSKGTQSVLNDKSKKVLKFQRNGIAKIITKIVIGIIPIIAIGTSLAIFQHDQSSEVWKHILMIDSYGQNLENIKLINAYGSQFGYELDDFKSLSNSINSQFSSIIENSYTSARFVQQNLAKMDIAYVTQMNALNQMEFCELVKLVSAKTGGIQCDQTQQITYAKKTKNEVFISYLQTARSLHFDYQYISTISDQRQFMQDIRHQQMQRKSMHLQNIEQYIIQQYSDIFARMIRIYQQTFIPVSLSLIPLIILIWVFWVSLQIKEMRQQLSDIRIMGQLITMNDIKNNQQLKLKLIQCEKYFAFAM